MQTTDLIAERIPLPLGELRVLQPRDAAEGPDDRGVEWAPVVPYWSVLWRSGVALARERAGRPLEGRRGVELGCGLAVPSLAAALAGGKMLATDISSEALELVTLNARANYVAVETAQIDWRTPQYLVEHAPFDFVLAADVLYEGSSVAPLLSLLPCLADEVWLADPDRPAAADFLHAASADWHIETSVRGVVRIHRLRRLSAPSLRDPAPTGGARGRTSRLLQASSTATAVPTGAPLVWRR